MRKLVLVIMMLLVLSITASADLVGKSPVTCSGAASAWTNCGNAFGNNVNQSTASVSASVNRTSQWRDYGFSIANSATIDSVVVRADYFGSSASNARINVKVSTDGGSTWGPNHVIGNTTTERSYFINVTGDFSWTAAKLNNSNLRVNVTCFRLAGNPTCNLDWIPVNVTYTPFDFSVSVTPTSGSSAQGTNTTTTVNVTKTVGIGQTVSLSTSGCPTGATCQFNPSSGTASYSSTLTLAAGVTTPAGVHVVTVEGAGDGKTRSVNYTWTVTDSLITSVVATATPTSGVVPLDVNFTGLATGGDFGDSGTSTQQNPSHTYTSTGTYFVNLTVTDFDGDKLSNTTTVTVNPQFNFDVSLSPGSDSVNQGNNATSIVTVTLTNGTTENVNLAITGCPTASMCSLTTSSGSPTYMSTLTVATTGSTPTGVYVVNVTGTSASLTRLAQYTLTVGDTLASANASANVTSGLTPLDVAFTGSGSGDSPLTYFWTFGDGANSSSQNPTHTYSSSGVFNATLTVSDFDGDSAQSTVTITVNDAFDYSIALVPTSGTTVAGGNMTTTVVVTLISGTTENVILSTSGCPSGAICQFSPSSGNAGYNSTLTIETSSSTPNGASSVTVNANSTSGLGRSASFSYNITKADLIVESVIFSPTSPTTNDYVTVNYTVKNIGTATAGNSVLNVTLDGSLRSRQGIGSLAPGASTTVSTTDSLSAGNHTFVAYADADLAVTESNEANNENSAIVTVTQFTPLNYTLIASPSLITFSSGGSGTSTINVTRISGSNENVDLTASGCIGSPFGLTCTITPIFGTTDFIAILNVSSPPGYNGASSVAINGNSTSGVQKTIFVSVNVTI
jgi:VCBS repeat-containing protein